MSLGTVLRRLLSGHGLRLRYPRMARRFDLMFSAAVPVEIAGRTLFVDPDDHGVGLELIAGAPYEPEETAVVRRLLGEGDLFIDAGANIGYYTTLAATIVGKRGRVWAFEPDRRNYSLLSRAIRANRFENVIAVRAALAEAPGVHKLVLDVFNHGGHSLIAVHNPILTEEVRAVTLDECLDVNRRARLIKMDIQGAEVRALRGMRRVIERSLPEVVLFTELWPAQLERAGSTLEAYLEALEACGLRAWSLAGEPLDLAGLAAQCSAAGWTNFLACARPPFTER